MSVQSFDLTSLLAFTPPRYICAKCCALLLHLTSSVRAEKVKCPVCGVEYLPTSSYSGHKAAEKYLKDYGFYIQFDDLIGHSQKLAKIAHEMRDFLARQRTHRSTPNGFDYFSPMRALFYALGSAKKFVHFTSYGISPMLLGAIKMAAQQVPIKGVVSNVEPQMVKELTVSQDEAPRLEIKVFERGAHWDKIPHQKLIVVDGLLAFKGSANLTISGWRKAAQGHEVIEVETDVREVVDLHNRFFSPIWAEVNEDIRNDTLPMEKYRVYAN